MRLNNSIRGTRRSSNITFGSTKFVGINVGGTSEYNHLRKYVDIMRTTRNLSKLSASPYSYPDNTGTVMAALNTNGWPTESFYTLVLVNASSSAANAGTYKGSFTGSATNITGGDCTIANITYNSGTNVTRFDFIMSSANDTSYITVTNPIGMNNFRIMRPGYAWNTTQIFTDEYAALLSKFGYCRYMDWSSTNGSTHVNWSDRFTWAGPFGRTDERFSWESIIEHANFFNKDAWINIPHQATDAYITSLAALFASTLNPGLNVYLEYSNEYWNTQPAFQPQALYIIAQTKLETQWLGGSANVTDMPAIAGFISSSTNGIDNAISGNVLTFKFNSAHGKSTGDMIAWMVDNSLSNANRNGIASCTVVDVFTFYVTAPSAQAVSFTRSANTYVYRNGNSALLFDTPTTGGQNEYYLAHRWAIRRLKQINDIFVTSFGSQARIRPIYADQVGGNWFAPVLRYAIAKLGPLNSWLYAMSSAPYIACTSAASTTVENALVNMQNVQLPDNLAAVAATTSLTKFLGIKYMAYEGGPDTSAITTYTPPVAKDMQSYNATEPNLGSIIRDFLQGMSARGVDNYTHYYLDANPYSSAVSAGNWNLLDDISNAGTSVKMMALSAKLITAKPSIDYNNRYFGTFPTFTSVRNDSITLDSGLCLYAMQAVCNFGWASIGGIYQGLIVPTVAFPARIIFLIYAPSNGNFVITPKTNINGVITSNPFDVKIDGVSLGYTRTAGANASPYSFVAVSMAPINVTLTKGFHLFELASTTTSGNQIGIGPITVAYA